MLNIVGSLSMEMVLTFRFSMLCGKLKSWNPGNLPVLIIAREGEDFSRAESGESIAGKRGHAHKR